MFTAVFLVERSGPADQRKRYGGAYGWLFGFPSALISIQKISEGGTSGTVVDPKKIFKMGLLRQASSIILCHNHPSGNLKPSEADIKITKKIKEAGDIMDIKVLDHIIVSETSYYSFADEGII